MNINGKPIQAEDVPSLDFFTQLQFSELKAVGAENEQDYTEAYSHVNVDYIIREANTSGEIPLRFGKCRLDDYNYPFSEQLWDFVSDPKDGVLLLSSAVGCGKTTILSSIMHERAIAGKSAGLYFNDLTLSALLRTCRSYSAKEGEYDLIQRLSKVDFLAIDEFGVDKNLEEESDFVSTVLRLRYDNGLPTAIATNLTIARFKISLCGINTKDKDVEELKALMPQLERDHPTLNRLISVLTPIYIKGTSNRGKIC